MSIPNLEAVARMRDLPADIRDRAISEASNVADLRPMFAERVKQREMALSYRRPPMSGDIA